MPQNNIYYSMLFRKVLGTLSEAQRRGLVGSEALRGGRGGIQRMVETSGLSKPAIRKGIRELRGKGKLAMLRLRPAGFCTAETPRRRAGTDLSLGLCASAVIQNLTHLQQVFSFRTPSDGGRKSAKAWRRAQAD